MGDRDLPRFDDLYFHPNFESHQAEKGRRIVTPKEAEEAWFGKRTIVPNRKGQAGPYLLLGRTVGGRDITVVLLRTDQDGTWLGYTAWDTKKSDF
jgi:hypothetical protein